MYQSSEKYTIKTEIFEGPMDLLVHLIKKNEVSIYDIPISDITRQFLDYIEWMKLLNIDFAGDFLYMAAILTNIKSRTLLPAHGTQGEEDDDPRKELTEALEEYLKIKSAAEDLSTREILNEDTFVRVARKKPLPADDDDQMIEVGLFELIDAFQKILDKIPSSAHIKFSADEISVKDKISEIIDVLETNRSITFQEMFLKAATKSEIIVTFLALLEMVKLELISVRQHSESGVIRLFYI
jgi:segregation and condensation protein A